MSKIYDVILAALEENEIKCIRNDGESMVDLAFKSERANYCVRVAAMEDLDLLFCIAEFPILVPEKNRPAMVEYVNKHNYNSLLGILAVDNEDGQLICRISCATDDDAINTKIVGVAISTVVQVLDDNYDDIMQIITAKHD